MINIATLPDMRLACPPDADDFVNCDYCDATGMIPDYQPYGDTYIIAGTQLCPDCFGDKVVKLTF